MKTKKLFVIFVAIVLAGFGGPESFAQTPKTVRIDPAMSRRKPPHRSQWSTLWLVLRSASDSGVVQTGQLLARRPERDAAQGAEQEDARDRDGSEVTHVEAQRDEDVERPGQHRGQRDQPEREEHRRGDDATHRRRHREHRC